MLRFIGNLNQVSLSFDKAKAQPGENVNVRVTADPMSTVNLLAVDQSVLLMKSGNDITQEEVTHCGHHLTSVNSEKKSIFHEFIIFIVISFR